MDVEPQTLNFNTMITYKTETDAEHRERMKELQLEMRAKMNAAKERRGLVICHTGDGKDKTSAAFGMLTRMLAHGHKCAVVQFIKSSNDAVESLLRGPLLTWDHVGEGFTWDTQDKTVQVTINHLENLPCLWAAVMFWGSYPGCIIRRFLDNVAAEYLQLNGKIKSAKEKSPSMVAVK